MKPGQYFVLNFDFSIITTDENLTEANEALIRTLNSSIETFYATYAAYLGENFADLRQKIDSKDPNTNLERCVNSVRRAIENDERLAGIEGIYMLVDEYDAFSNGYLEQFMTGGHKTAWEGTGVVQAFKSFWNTIKSCTARGIRRIFVTGISPLSVSFLGSAFNVTRNLSFDRDLAGLCGLTRSDLTDALKGICTVKEIDYDFQHKSYLESMTMLFNGYHFCMDESVETVFNTETCLFYLQRRLEGKEAQFRQIPDPPNSEVPEPFLRLFAASASAIRDFEEALKHDRKGKYMALKYDQFNPELTLPDLVC